MWSSCCMQLVTTYRFNRNRFRLISISNKFQCCWSRPSNFGSLRTLKNLLYCWTPAIISSESWPSSNFNVINSTGINSDFLSFLIQLTQREKCSPSIQGRNINILDPIMRLFWAVEFDRFNPSNDSRYRLYHIVPILHNRPVRESVPSNSFSVRDIYLQEFFSKISEDFITTFFYDNFAYSAKL